MRVPAHRGEAAKDVLAILLAVVCVLSGPVGVAATPGSDGLHLSTSAWLGDLRALVRFVESSHPDLGRLGREGFEAAAKSLEARIPSLSDNEILVGLAQLVALLEDSHTAVYLEACEGVGRFPVELAWFEDGLYVVAVAPGWEQALGSRVTGIGKASIAEAYEAVKSAIPHDNGIWPLARSPRYFVVPEILAGLGLTPDANGATFYVEKDGTQMALDLPAIPPSGPISAWSRVTDARPLYQVDPSSPYWWTLLGTQTIYVRYAKCADALRFRTSVADPVAKSMGDESIRRVIVDLRNNGGGDSRVVAPLVQALAGSRFVQRGRLFVLVDSGTSSGGVMAAADLVKWANAIVVGGPTGGSLSMTGNVASTTLSNSRVRVECGTRRFATAIGGGSSLIPDLVAPFYFEDYASGLDPAMSVGLAYDELSAASAGAVASSNLELEGSEVQAKVDPSTGALSVTCRMRFRAAEPGATLGFSLNRALNVVDVNTSRGTVREKLGGKRWAVYALDCALRKGEGLSLEVSYDGDPFAYGSLPGSWRGPDSFALTPAMWLPLPAVSPFAESASPQDPKDGEVLWNLSIQAPEGARLLADGPAGVVCSPAEGEGLALHGYVPDILFAGKYEPSELSASGVAFEVWSTAENTAEGQFVGQAVPSLLTSYETLLGSLPAARVNAVLVPDDVLPLVSFHPDRALVTIPVEHGVGFNEALQDELRRESAEALGGLYVGDRGLAAYLADCVLSGHDPALREAASADRQRTFRSTLARDGDRAVYGAGGPDSAALVNKAAAIWHMLATVYGEDEVVGVGVKLSRERVSRASIPGASFATGQEVSGFDVLAALPQDMTPVARPWFEKVFRFDLALEEIQVAADERQGAGSRSPRWVVSGTVADRGDPAFPWGLLPWAEVRVWSEGAPESGNAGSMVSVRVPLDEAQSGKARFSVALDAKPLKVALDPNLLDYDPANNSVRVSTERPISGLPILGAALLLLLAWSLMGRRSRRMPPSPAGSSEKQS